MSGDGSGDEGIKLQGLDNFSFSLADARRDPLTGEFGEDEDMKDIEDVGALADAIAADSDNESIEAFTDKADSDDSDEGGYNTNEDCGPEYEPDDNLIVLEECPEPKEMEGLEIAHRFDEGWSQCLGVVRRKVTCSLNVEENGRYAVKYSDSRKEYFHDLFLEDYGPTKMWVVVAPK